VITLQLSVNSALTSTTSGSFCAGGTYIFNGTTLNTAGTYTDTLSASGGCDSIVTLNLTMLNASHTNLSDSICNGDTLYFNGQTLTANGVYRATLVGSNSCDSIVSLTLIILPKPTPVVTKAGDTLSTTSFATYQWLRNGTAINGANSQSYIATQNGQYAVVVSTSVGCNDTSAATNVIGLSLNDLEATVNLRLFPNPSTGIFNLEAAGLSGKVNLKLYDVFGKLLQNIHDETANGSYNTVMDLNAYASGVYFIELQAGEVYLTRKIELLK
jgi:hypothetical protein